MKIIDVNSWKRKHQYENFSKYSCPVFHIGAEIDVTKLVSYCKNSNMSFFAEFVFLLMKTVNEIEEFKSRIDNGQVVAWEIVHPNYVVLNNDETLSSCQTEFIDNHDDFCKRINVDISRTKNSSEKEFNKVINTDCVYISCMPWIDMIYYTNPYNYDDINQTSIPRFIWSKFIEVSGNYKMKLFIAVHHGFVDGIHIVRLLEKLQSYLDSIG
ncbi:MAG: hypothetical protein K5923_03275 [Clostridia bacterium]|nr:hypothetical protein [Clostridia bacterium]